MKNLKFITFSGLFSAIIFVNTYAIQIPLPGIATGGLMHLGNITLFIIAIIFGKKYGAVSAALGMTLFDILSGWAIWAPCTFIVRGIMGYLVGAIANGNGRNGENYVWNLLAMIISSIWMILGYFGYNLILYQNLAAAIASIPGDIVQIVIGIIIAIPAIVAINKSGMTKTLRKMMEY